MRDSDMMNLLMLSPIQLSYTQTLRKRLVLVKCTRLFLMQYHCGIIIYNNIVEPLRDTYWRTLSHKVCTIEKYSLFRYLQIADRSTSLPGITADKNSGSPSSELGSDHTSVTLNSDARTPLCFHKQTLHP